MPVAAAAGDAGWRAGIAVWAPVAVLAALPWLWPSVRRGVAVERRPSGAEPVPSGPGRVTVVALTVFCGLQSLGAFVVMGRLPAIFVDAGVPGPAAGLLLASTAAARGAVRARRPAPRGPAGLVAARAQPSGYDSSRSTSSTGLLSATR